MTDVIFLNAKTLLSMTLQQAALQQQIIEAQQKIIELQQQVAALTPKDPTDKEAFWHVHSGGVMSDEAANSTDVEMVKKFQKWNTDFAKKYIKPYVSHKVYGECLNQMTRGLSQRISELEAGKISSDPAKPPTQPIKLRISPSRERDKKPVRLATPRTH